MGHGFSFMFKENISEIPRYNAVFIRATTDPLNTSYVVSKTAYELGLRVVDDPKSIQICGNKIHLYQLFEKYNIPHIPTMFINKDEFHHKRIMNIFKTFGILMPRNSKEQGMVGMEIGLVEGRSASQKRKLLDQAIPLATTLRLPGHIMLYLGKDRGKHYAIHSIWGVQEAGKASPTVEKIGRTVVSDLSLGEKGPNRSLLDRITDLRTIGSTF